MPSLLRLLSGPLHQSENPSGRQLSSLMVSFSLALVLLSVLLSCSASQSQANPIPIGEGNEQFERDDRDYRPLQFGKRDNYRPLQFGKKSVYRPLQFGKRGGARSLLSQPTHVLLRGGGDLLEERDPTMDEWILYERRK